MIRPEPTDDERRAILATLAREEPAAPDAYRSAWRAAALEEGVDGEGSGDATDSGPAG